MYPKTPDEWWALVDSRRDDLLSLIRAFHPNAGAKVNYRITAERAEAACEQVREEIRHTGIKEPAKVFQELIERRDPRCLTILSETWFGMPESMGVRDVPGFGALCDLCSEGHLLGEL